MTESDWIGIIEKSPLYCLRQSRKELKEVLSEDDIDSYAIGRILWKDPYLMISVYRYSKMVSVCPPMPPGASLSILGQKRMFDFLELLVDIETKASGLNLVNILKMISRSKLAMAYAHFLALRTRNPRIIEVKTAVFLFELAPLHIWLHEPEMAMKFQQLCSTSTKIKVDFAAARFFGMRLSSMRSAFADVCGLHENIIEIWKSDSDNFNGKCVKLSTLLSHIPTGEIKSSDYKDLFDEVLNFAGSLPESIIERFPEKEILK